MMGLEKTTDGCFKMTYLVSVMPEIQYFAEQLYQSDTDYNEFKMKKFCCLSVIKGSEENGFIIIGMRKKRFRKTICHPETGIE